MMRLPLVAKRFAALTKRLPSVAKWFGCASLIGSLWSLMMLPANPQRGAAEPISERSEPLIERSEPPPSVARIIYIDIV